MTRIKHACFDPCHPRLSVALTHSYRSIRDRNHDYGKFKCEPENHGTRSRYKEYFKDAWTSSFTYSPRGRTQYVWGAILSRYVAAEVSSRKTEAVRNKPEVVGPSIKTSPGIPENS